MNCPSAPPPPTQIRKSVRHYFLRSRGLKLGYDVATWAATQLTICYTVMPFLLLSVEPTFIYYKSVNSFCTLMFS